MAMKTRSSELTNLLKRELNTSRLKFEGSSGGGCISEGKACETDAGKVFIKINRNEGARTMFDGEMAGLEAIGAVGVVRVPKPVKVVTIPSGGAAMVMENFDFTGSLRSKASSLGEQVARLHLHNAELAAAEEAGSQSVHQKDAPEAVKKFGFHVTTCCGFIPQNNEWAATWEEFYARKLDQQITLLQKEYNDRDASQEWAVLQRKLPQFFSGMHIAPALLHGDLWAGNAAETEDAPVIYDPASFYGHSEFEMSIASMFSGFPKSFFDSYFKIIPKENGYSTRLQLYQLFHNLNHWNHFGEGYKHSSLTIFRKLNKLQL